ncbi:organic cation transporter protein-like [Plodia interpunctella]|uniref:organic cation transporter protein-like n=1 Tax=Plodia interpunctella TaxID=58824 RepID=UPI002368EA3A|nr:organic cation transporter protein-like [Plodia interpunctella]XP_053604722.1 organic cation transporter protein-like [Plodia interpunctella]
MGKKTKEKEEEMAANEGFNLDGILSELGSFGKYQLLLLFLLAFRDSFLAMCNFNFVFTAAEVLHRCVVSECDAIDPRFNASWISYVLNDTKICQRPEPIAPALREYDSGYCLPHHFDFNSSVACEQIVYENYNSIVAEFNLGCEPWKRTMIGTVHNMGLVFSFLLLGFISDRYGRKVVIVATPLAVGVAGLVKSFSVNYWMLLVFEFLETALGYGNASLVLSLETVSQKRRVIFSCISDMMSSFGSAFFSLIAWKIPYWRHLMRAIYAPLLVVVFYIFLVDEGVRWLLAHNKKDEAVRVLNKVAKINKITLSTKAKQMLRSITEQRTKADEAGHPRPEKPHLALVLRSKKMLLRVALIAACFFCGMFVFNGTIINSSTISGDRYLNMSILLLVAVPTRIITALTLTRYGRKAPICVAYCLCTMFFIMSAVIPKSWAWASVVLYVFGKMCTDYGLFSICVVALEVFPTTSRNSLTNIANTVGRLGTVLAPQVPLLEHYLSGMPSIVFGVVSLCSAMLTLLLPDTSRAALPDHIEEAEKIGDGEDGEEIPQFRDEEAGEINTISRSVEKSCNNNIGGLTDFVSKDSLR